LNDLWIAYIISAAFLGIVILINLTVGFATTGNDDKDRGTCCRFRGCATGCVVKAIFAINYILFFSIFAATIIFAILLFICFITANLCNDGRQVTVIREQSPFFGTAGYAEDLQQIDLRQFSPLLNMKGNETQLLLFKDHRLKKLCTDYLPGILFYVILVAVGFVLMTIGFVHFLINLSINWVRRTTTQKYAELFYINGAEMIAFGGDDHQDVGHRY
jgi:hypothetical protein